MKYQSKAEAGFVRGLQNAEAKGFAASQDPNFTERDCPYTRYEHKTSWLDGFRRGRGTTESNGLTKNAQAFVEANDRSGVVAGAAHGGGGGTYTLADGRVFSLTLQDMRSIPVGRYPIWDFSGCHANDRP